MTKKADLKRSLHQMSLKAEKALKAAVAKLYEEHRRSGESLPIWHDGKVVWVKAGRASKAP